MRLEHVGPWRGEDVVRQLGLAVDVHRHGGLAGEEAVVDLSGSLGQLQGDGFGVKNVFLIPSGNDQNASSRGMLRKSQKCARKLRCQSHFPSFSAST